MLRLLLSAALFVPLLGSRGSESPLGVFNPVLSRDRQGAVVSAAENRIDVIARNPSKKVVAAASRLLLTEDGISRNISSFSQVGCGDTAVRPIIVILLDGSHFIPGAGTHDESEAARSIARDFLQNLSTELPLAVYSKQAQDLHILCDVSEKKDRFSTAAIEQVLKVFRKPPILNPSKGTLFRGVMGSELSLLEAIANHLATLPGRKALLWYCQGIAFPMKIPPAESELHDRWISAVTALQRANVAVYSIFMGIHGHTSVFNELADVTGGRSYPGFFSLKKAFEDAMKDSRCYTQIGWQTGETAPVSRIHTIRVRSMDAMDLIYPHGRLEAVLPMDQKSRIRAAEQGLIYPLKARAIPLHLSTTRTGNRLSADLSFDTRFIRLQNDGEIRRGFMDVIWAWYGTGGFRLAAGERNEIRLVLRPDAFTNLPDREEKIHQDLAIPASATEMRVAVRDAATGAIGSEFVPLAPN